MLKRLRYGVARSVVYCDIAYVQKKEAKSEWLNLGPHARIKIKVKIQEVSSELCFQRGAQLDLKYTWDAEASVQTETMKGTNSKGRRCQKRKVLPECEGMWCKYLGTCLYRVVQILDPMAADSSERV